MDTTHNSRQRRRPNPVLVVGLALILAALGCNLTSGGDNGADSATPTFRPPVLTPTFVPLPTDTPFVPTVTPLPSATPQPTATLCVQQTTWQTYIVVSGDTLSSIAQRITSTGLLTSAQMIAQANCLSNPNEIRVGQVLFVPGMVPAPTPIASNTPTSDPGAPVFRSAFTVERHWVSNGQNVTYASTVRVDAGVVDRATQVVFNVTLPTGGTPQLVGTDADPYDGSFVDFTFGAPGTYRFQAEAVNELGLSTRTPVFTIVYDPSFTPPEGRYNELIVTPFVAFDGSWYTLTANTTVSISWPHAPVGALEVRFLLTPTGTGTSDAATVIGLDTNAANGSSISYLVPAGLMGHLEAVASMPDGSELRSRTANVFAQ